MKLTADDWTFIEPTEPGCVVALDLFLANGQHARLEVYPLLNPHSSDADQIPELVVLSESSGETLSRPVRRWISRPPDSDCPWSSLELSSSLIRQINERIDQLIESD